MRDVQSGDGRLGLTNVVIAVFVGMLVCAAVFIWGVPGLDPSLWEETSVAAGIRPPRTIFPGYWRILAGFFVSAFGVDSAIRMLTIVGAVIGGICVSFVYLIVRQILSLLLRTGRTYPAWYKFIAPFFSAVAAFLLGISTPFGTMVRVFSPDELRFLMLLLGIHLSLRWFVVGGNWRIFLMMFLMGVMGAETPFAFLMPLVFYFAYRSVWHRILDGLFVQPETFPDAADMPKWRMFFLFLGGLAFGVWINAMHFVSIGGLEANGWSSLDIYFRYAAGYWHVLADAGSLLGWILGLGFGIFPLIVSLTVFPMVARDDQPMRFNLGVAMFFVGAMAVMQCGAFPAARFWTFARESVVLQSSFLHVFFVFCAMIVIALFGSAFAFECQRTYLNDEEDATPPGPLLKGVVPALAIVLVVLAAWHLPKPTETEMQRIVDDAVDEIVEECGDAKYLFTDGNMDAAIELAAAKKGKSIKTFNLMSGPTKWEINQRCSCFNKDSEDGSEREDYKSAETGVSVLLRVWVSEKPGGLDDAAMQIGFDIWKRERKPLPTFSGLVARTRGLDDAAAERGIKAATALSGRMFAITDQLEYADPSLELSTAMRHVKWRISRIAQYRSDTKLAEKLILSSSVLTRMYDFLVEEERRRTFMQMTPREGLRLALMRADFAEARRYSAAVLRYNADDYEANFGMGMSALMLKQFDEAEMYLKRVLKKRPEEPAVLNNLSIICRKKGRWKEAEDYARKAIKILPDSPEVKQTLSDALKKAP